MVIDNDVFQQIVSTSMRLLGEKYRYSPSPLASQTPLQIIEMQQEERLSHILKHVRQSIMLKKMI